MIHPKISIVIPSFNKFKYIGKTLDSIFLQKYPNLEVIIQDGGSTDGTLQIIKKYAKRYPRVIKWVSKKDKGQLDAINKGLAKATGEIISFINADDVYTKNAFDEISKAYGESPGSIWFAGQGTVIDKKGKEIAKLVTIYKNIALVLNSKFYLLITNYLMQPSIFLAKDAYDKYGPFSGTDDFVTEYDLWLKLSRKRMPYIINKTLSRFRIEPGTKTKNMFIKLLEVDSKIVRKYTKSKLFLFLHDLHNISRIIVEKFV